jgi:hypothetical protein
LSFARGPYRRALNRTVTYRYTTLSIFLAALIICLSLVPSGILRVVFFPSVPSDLININLDMPQGTAWQTTHAYALRIEDAAWAMNERFREQDSQGRDVIETMMVVSDSDTSARVQMGADRQRGAGYRLRDPRPVAARRTGPAARRAFLQARRRGRSRRLAGRRAAPRSRPRSTAPGSQRTETAHGTDRRAYAISATASTPAGAS